MQQIQSLIQSTETSPKRHVPITTRTTEPVSSEDATTSNAVPRQSQLLYESSSLSHTKSTTVTSTDQMNMSIIATSNEQTISAIKATSTLNKTTILTSTTQTTTSANTPSRSTIATSSASTTYATTRTDVKTSATSAKPLTLTSTGQTTMPDRGTSSSPFPCSASYVATLNLNFPDVLCQPCLASSTLCNDQSTNGTVPDYCKCDADEIWIIVQTRFDGSVDFYRNWTDYKNGFGDLKGEYWLGNDLLHQMTSSSNCTLKIYLTDWNSVTKYAQYDIFKIADEDDGYRLTIGGYSGDAGESMIRLSDGQMFSTIDRDNDVWDGGHCAEQRDGGWWYGKCSDSNLNGIYYLDQGNFRITDIFWMSWYDMSNKTSGYSLKETKMMIKSVP